jgi:uncharacterized NAD(P)/FAD-binding protein YdhS
VLTIAIVGGGCSGALLAANLARAANGLPLRIVMIERRPRLGRGVAYDTTCPAHLLNVAAGGMSALPDDPDHFLQWSRQRLPATQPGDFLPRMLYGEYVEGVLFDALAAARLTVEFTSIRDDVVDIAPAAGRPLILALAGGGVVPAERAVLALGNYAPADPPASSADFGRFHRYLQDPWSAEVLETVGPEEDLLLLGTGLTMIDVVLSLRSRSHAGQVVALSRHGLLPAVQRADIPRLEPVLRGACPATAGELVRRVREEVRANQARGLDWRSVVDSLRPITADLWQGLADEERPRFLRHVRPYWEIHRHRVAPEVWSVIETMKQNGRFTAQAGRIVNLRENETGVDVWIRPRGVAEPTRMKFARIINCTGPCTNYGRLSHPLIDRLRERRMIRADPLGLGLETTADGAILDGDGRASGLLLTLGPPRKAGLWESTAVPEIRQQAADLARYMLALLWPARGSR